MTQEYKHLLIKPETHERMKEQAQKAGMTFDGYLRYLLNLGEAYPVHKKEAANEH